MWVRGPGLAPNLQGTGNARVVASGTDCANIVKWDVGLNRKKRSIVRLEQVFARVRDKQPWFLTTDDNFAPIARQGEGC